MKNFGKIGLYMRLSKDDEKQGESASIEHQRMVLHKYVEENKGSVFEEYTDDGWSGTNFDRPAVTKMLKDAQDGKIDTVIVKDLSRFGRNYIQVGQYIDYIFPAYGIRFIAIGDGVDTADRFSTAMDMMPIMNVFNEWHAANTSKKIRAVLEASMRAGKYTSWNYPYGYKAGGDENRIAEIDEAAAATVRRIYDLRLQGQSLRTIARTLTDDGVPNPAAHYTRQDGKKSDRRFSPLWSPKTVMCILADPTYTGCTVQHRTTSISYKNHKVVAVPEDERIVKQNAHAPIISREVWEKVQKINKNPSRGRADKSHAIHSLSGMLVCAECGKKLKYKAGRGGCGCYVCRTYIDLGKKYCSSHSISERDIEELVLCDIRSMLKSAFDEVGAKEHFLRGMEKIGEKTRLSAEKRIKNCENRLAELDLLIKSAFEEKVLNKLPQSVCENLCRKYEDERITLTKTVEELTSGLPCDDDINGRAEEYVESLKRYMSCESLTREMCLQLIDCIIIGERQAEGQTRRIDIVYRFAATH